MAILDELIENLIERKVIALNGTFTVACVDGGLKVKGQLLSSLRDQKKNKTMLNANVPIDADVSIAPVVIPVPPLK
jgi:hypothetical protein